MQLSLVDYAIGNVVGDYICNIKAEESGASLRRPAPLSQSQFAPRVLAVSNLDLLPRSVPGSLFCAYRKPSAGGFGDVVTTFEAKLPSLLDHFLLLTGRIVANPRSGRPEVHCNNQGAELVVGEVDVALASLDYGDLGASLARTGVPVQYGADIALSVQLVSFACGGFAVAWGSNHALVDGYSGCLVANAWSQLVRSGTIPATATPNHDRSVFRPRATPSYGSSVRELFMPSESEHLVNALTNESSFVRRTYYVDLRDVATLQAQASREDAAAGERGATRLEAVSAYLWKVFATVVGESDERCRMGWWVDGRRRLTAVGYEAAAMRNYVGNVTTFAVAEASVDTIQRRPLPDVASMVRESIKSTATGEHFQELTDWVEEHKAAKYVERATVGLGSPVLAVSAFTSFNFDTDFGFGHAALVMPTSVNSGRPCCGLMRIIALPGGNGWLIGMSVWPRLAPAFDSDKHRIFKPLSAEHLGLGQHSRL
ncbi:coniferyl alcohol acyltransferase-like [Lolium perenne]|uniref:coniferyl alcohol acyltransferase-like n=1 Tax=Lolium perenne TaxID=4522 RepID=UPI003A9A60C9